MSVHDDDNDILDGSVEVYASSETQSLSNLPAHYSVSVGSERELHRFHLERLTYSTRNVRLFPNLGHVSLMTAGHDHTREERYKGTVMLSFFAPRY